MNLKLTRGSGVLSDFFISGYLIIYIFQRVSTAQIVVASHSSVSFYRYRDLNVGLSSSNESWSETSDVSCALTIRNIYPEARSFMFNRQTLECAPGLYVRANSNSETSRDDLYNKVNCDVTKGFRIFANGTSVACLGFFNYSVNYTAADTACGSRGSYLVSVKTADKLNMLRKEMPWGTETWIGLDDLSKEGTYVWKEDNSSLTREDMRLLLKNDDSTTAFGNQDCVLYAWGLSDGLRCTLCSKLLPYVCEIYF